MADDRERTEVRVEVDGRTLTLVNLEKVMYPATGTTKGEVLHYYTQIAPALLPHLARRAVTRIRWPHGTAEQSFFEKNVPGGTPSWVRVAEVPTTGSRAASAQAGLLRYPVLDSLPSLVWAVNLAALELHVHQWTVDDDGVPEPPDRMVIDLDPGEPAGLGECAQVALLVRDRMATEGLRCAPVTSGSKGLHLYVALEPDRSSEEVRDWARSMAEDLQRAHPDLVVSQMAKARRPGKVFLDWSQNVGAKTTISPYSLRGRARPTVAAPRTWAEVEAGADDHLSLEQLDAQQVLARVARDGDLLAAALASH